MPIPSGFALADGATGDYAVVSGDPTASGGILRSNPTLSPGIKHLIWEDEGTVADVDLKARLRVSLMPPGSAPISGLLLRYSYDGNGTDGYTAHLAPGRLQIGRYLDGAFTPALAEVPVSWSARQWYWLRANAAGTTLRAKVWPDDGSPEPADWMVSVSDAAVPGPGKVGLASWENAPVEPAPATTFARTAEMGAHVIAPGSFLPTSLPGLLLWLDATDAASLTLSDGAVAEWRDRSGNGRHAAQATAAARPTQGTINGAPSINFGAGLYLRVESFPVLPECTVFVGLKWTNASAPDSSADAGTILALGDANATEWAWSAGASSTLSGETLWARQVLATSTVHLLGSGGVSWAAGEAMRLRYEASGAAGHLVIAANGQGAPLTLSANAGAVGWHPGQYVTAPAPLLIGARLGSTSGLLEPLRAEVNEIVVYGRVLSPAETALVEAWLTTKVGQPPTPGAGTDPNAPGSEFTAEFTSEFGPPPPPDPNTGTPNAPNSDFSTDFSTEFR